MRPSFAAAPPPVAVSIPIEAKNKSRGDAVFDLAATLSRVEGDRKLLREIIGLFSVQSQQLLPQIRAASERGDGRSLERAAHKLKGSMGCFGAGLSVEAALRLENMGHSGEFAHAKQACTTLEYEVGRLLQALTTFTMEGAANEN